jgi:GntR family transcriptional regulator
VGRCPGDADPGGGLTLYACEHAADFLHLYGHVRVAALTPYPRHAQVAADLRAAIAGGRHPLGSALPSEAELSDRYGVSRGTVRRALSSLVAEGSLLSRQGARHIVLGPPRTQSFSELLSFSSWARAIGEPPGGRVVELRRRPAGGPEATQLGIQPGAPTYRLVRVRTLGGRAVMLERTTFVEAVGGMLGSLRLEGDSIYERLAERDVRFAHARHLIDAVAADAADAALLQVPVGTPLLRQRRRTVSPEGVPLEWSDDRYLGDAVAFVIDNSVGSTNLERLRSADAGA